MPAQRVFEVNGSLDGQGQFSPPTLIYQGKFTIWGDFEAIVEGQLRRNDGTWQTISEWRAPEHVAFEGFLPVTGRLFVREYVSGTINYDLRYYKEPV